MRSEEPPEFANRTLERSYASAPGVFTMSLYIAGTPCISVIPSDSISWSVASAFHSGIGQEEPPSNSVAIVVMVIP
jgi:hypothetical protein